MHSCIHKWTHFTPSISAGIDQLGQMGHVGPKGVEHPIWWTALSWRSPHPMPHLPLALPNSPNPWSLHQQPCSIDHWRGSCDGWLWDILANLMVCQDILQIVLGFKSPTYILIPFQRRVWSWNLRYVFWNRWLLLPQHVCVSAKAPMNGPHLCKSANVSQMGASARPCCPTSWAF